MSIRYQIDVTQDDIENGVPGNAQYCPVALALARACPGVLWRVRDGCAIRHDGPDSTSTWIHLPRYVWDWVREYDRVSTVPIVRFARRSSLSEYAAGASPFEFELVDDA